MRLFSFSLVVCVCVFVRPSDILYVGIGRGTLFFFYFFPLFFFHFFFFFYRLIIVFDFCFDLFSIHDAELVTDLSV